MVARVRACGARVQRAVLIMQHKTSQSLACNSLALTHTRSHWFNSAEKSLELGEKIMMPAQFGDDEETDLAPSQPLAPSSMLSGIIVGWMQSASTSSMESESGGGAASSAAAAASSANDSSSSGGKQQQPLPSDEENESSDEENDPDTADDVKSADEIMREAMAAAQPTAETPPTEVAYWKASGDGLQTAGTGQSTTFSIEGFDANGERVNNPADADPHKFSVTLTGTSTVRTRVYDEGHGCFCCEYRVMQSGKYRLSVMRGGVHLAGSPFTVVAKTQVKGLNDWKASRQR